MKKTASELQEMLAETHNELMKAVVAAHVENVLKRLMRVIIDDGEQFVAGAIRKIAEDEYNIAL